MAENNSSLMASSTPHIDCNTDDTPVTLNLTEDSGYSSYFSGSTSTNSSSLLNQTRSLDQSQKQLSAARETTNSGKRKRLCLAGQKYVDFVYYFGGFYRHDMILKKILFHLNDEDLHSCSLVSKLWRDVIISMPPEEKRLRVYAKKIELNKENRQTNSPKKSHPQENSRCFTSLTPRHKLVQIQNIQESASSSSASPPAFTHDCRFAAYQREAQKVKVGKRLHSCPKCKFPSQVDPNIPNAAMCTNTTCTYRFCILCQCQEHPMKMCHFLSTPVARKPGDIFGTAKSKRNLKRLLI